MRMCFSNCHLRTPSRKGVRSSTRSRWNVGIDRFEWRRGEAGHGRWDEITIVEHEARGDTHSWGLRLHGNPTHPKPPRAHPPFRSEGKRAPSPPPATATASRRPETSAPQPAPHVARAPQPTWPTCLAAVLHGGAGLALHARGGRSPPRARRRTPKSQVPYHPNISMVPWYDSSKVAVRHHLSPKSCTIQISRWYRGSIPAKLLCVTGAIPGECLHCVEVCILDRRPTCRA